MLFPEKLNGIQFLLILLHSPRTYSAVPQTTALSPCEFNFKTGNLNKARRPSANRWHSIILLSLRFQGKQGTASIFCPHLAADKGIILDAVTPNHDKVLCLYFKHKVSWWNQQQSYLLSMSLHLLRQWSLSDITSWPASLPTRKPTQFVFCLPKALLLATRLHLTGVKAEGWRDWTHYRVWSSLIRYVLLPSYSKC